MSRPRWNLPEGLVMGGLGVLGFSFTLPATRAAVLSMGGITVGLGRSIVAALLAVLLLVALGERPPPRRYWPPIVTVAVGMVVGFSLFSALALEHLPATHGAVVVGLQPAATALMAVLRTDERPPRAFWLSCVAGLVAVLFFAVTEGAGGPQGGDLLLLMAVGLGAVGYAEGGRAAREIGGWRVVCWALVVAAPALVGPVALSLIHHGLSGSPGAWLGFAYVSVVSMFLASIAWYRGLAAGGVARIGQLQLVQPVLTLLWAACLLGERVTPQTIVAALLVIASAALTQWTRAPQARGQTAKSA